MTSVKDHLLKMREERIAREKARIEKLRELNLKKYGKEEPQMLKPASSVSFLKTSVSTNPSRLKNNFHVNNTSKRPITAPIDNKTDKNEAKNLQLNKPLYNSKPVDAPKFEKLNKKDFKPFFGKHDKTKNVENSFKKPVDKQTVARRQTVGDSLKKPANEKVFSQGLNKNKDSDEKNENTQKNNPETVRNEAKMSRKSFLPKFEQPKQMPKSKLQDSRKSIQPKMAQSSTNVNSNRQSVFERLYQPKNQAPKKTDDFKDSVKIQNDPNFLKKVVKNASLILNKRHTVFDSKNIEKANVLPRRSISAVHFRHISKNELSNCMHKWSSIGEKLDKVHLNNINEDEAVKEDKIVSAVKSERKRVKFQTPIYNFNTPKPEELQSRLQNWLQKRGKSIDSYHHLQCFGIHHLERKEFKPVNLEVTKFDEFDDDDKENQPVESDSDNDSYEDNMNNKTDDTLVQSEMPTAGNDFFRMETANSKWRRASNISDCVTDMNETEDSMLTSIGTPKVDELLLGALNDLTELLKEGFDWEQSARWLRAIRERFPAAPSTAAYWECRAALEDSRGDLPASVQCWEEAIAKGTERSVVEANLDQLLDKFMQLRISPSSGARKQPDPKLVDVKNVFKSTLIRFAVQQAKLRQSQEPKFTVTPVRRSARLSCRWSSKRTPLQECASVKQAGLLVPQHPVLFVPNDKLCGSP